MLLRCASAWMTHSRSLHACYCSYSHLAAPRTTEPLKKHALKRAEKKKVTRLLSETRQCLHLKIKESNESRFLPVFLCARQNKANLLRPDLKERWNTKTPDTTNRGAISFQSVQHWNLRTEPRRRHFRLHRGRMKTFLVCRERCCHRFHRNTIHGTLAPVITPMPLSWYR